MTRPTTPLLLLIALALALPLSAGAKDKVQPIEQVGSELMVDPIVSIVGGRIYSLPWEAAQASTTNLAALARITITPGASSPSLPGYVPPTPQATNNAGIVAGAFGSALGNAMVIASMEKARSKYFQPLTMAAGGEASLLAFAHGVSAEAGERGLPLQKTIWGSVPGETAVKEQFKLTDASHVFAVSRLDRPLTAMSLDNRRLIVVATLALYERSGEGMRVVAGANIAYIGDPGGDGLDFWSANHGERLKAALELAGRQMAGALLDRSPGFARAGVVPDAHRAEGLGVISRDGSHAHMLSPDNYVLVLPVHAAVAAVAEPETAPAASAN